MQSGEVAVALEEFARAHAFKFIPKTVSHWQMYVGKQLVNVYFGRKGFSLYVDSSSPAGAYRSYSISEIFEQIEAVHRAALAAESQLTTLPVTVPTGTVRRLSATKTVRGMRCRVTTTCPTGVATGQPGLSHVVLISDGTTQLGAILHDAEVDAAVSTYDAADVTLTVTGVEPTKQLIRLLRFAAHTLEEMVERNERVASSVG